MRIALLQCNPVVGDIDGNALRLRDAVVRAAALGADLCVTPELAICGYPPRDLLLREGFVTSCMAALKNLARELNVVREAAGRMPAVLVGTPVPNASAVGKPCFNGAVLLRDGAVDVVACKTLLPCYDVFDERRYFEPGNGCGVVQVAGCSVAVSICEDAWNDATFWTEHRLYAVDPVADVMTRGTAAPGSSAVAAASTLHSGSHSGISAAHATSVCHGNTASGTGRSVDLLVNLSASPFTLGKQALRERMFAALALCYNVPVAYTNQVGGNDDVLFAGKSLVFNEHGGLIARGMGFCEDLVLADLVGMGNGAQNVTAFGGAEEDGNACNTGGRELPPRGAIAPDDPVEEAQVWQALVMGTRDYVRKCGFSRVILGLSGGVDSALVAAVATEALGADNVLGICMPSPYSSEGSVSDALALARKLGIATRIIPIAPMMQAFDAALAAPLPSAASVAEGAVVSRTSCGSAVIDVAAENIQSRIRGNLLMALSNREGAMLLTTGNKSELAVGYCTIYGDMAGGLAVISDLPKTLVWRVCRWINATRGHEVIPEVIIAKAPSAELRPDQKDSDNLPEYPVLDAMLHAYVEEKCDRAGLLAMGFSVADVDRVLRLVRLAEFKRRQAAPGLKITSRAFGTGWRMPVACKS